jgi:hypothetical protein
MRQRCAVHTSLSFVVSDTSTANAGRRSCTTLTLGTSKLGRRHKRSSTVYLQSCCADQITLTQTRVCAGICND